MSDVDFLVKLLDGVAAEWRTLGELTLPTSNIKWKEVNRTYKYIDLTSVSIETKAILETSEINKNTAPSRAQKLVEKDDVLFATTRPTQLRYCLIGDEHDGEIASTGYCVLRARTSKVLPKWIWHWMGSTAFKEYLAENQSGSAYPAVSDAKVKDFTIPIPCPENPQKSLEIQGEIVRILDAFTELTVELTAELTAELTTRKKQYSHYREQLLSFEEGAVEWKTLEAITTSIASGRNKARTAEGAFPVYGSTGLIGFADKAAHSGEALLIARVGANAGRVNAVSGSFDVSDNTLIIRPIDAWNIRFAFHQLTHMNLNQYAVGGGQPLVTGGLLKSLLVPFPPLKEQERIAGILDKFDAITNSLSEGLPREIMLRQKQYEYYRDLLLSFPKPEAVEA